MRLPAGVIALGILLYLTALCEAHGSFFYGRSNPAFATDGCYSIWVGGSNQTGCLDTVEYYDSVGDLVTPIPTIYAAACWLCATAPANNRFLFAGGEDATISTFYSQVCLYTPNTGGMDCSTLVLSKARSRFAAASANGWAVFAGGYDGSALSDLDAFGPANQHVTAQMSVLRKYPAAAGAGNFVYIAGGYDIVPGTYHTTIEIFDTVQTSLSTSNMFFNQGRIQLKAAASANGQYVTFTGGLQSDSSASFEMDLIDTTTDVLEVITMPDAMQEHAVSGLSNGTNEFFVLAGGLLTGTSPIASDLVYIFDIGSRSWLPNSPTLSSPRQLLAGGLTAGEAVFGGGDDGSNYYLPIEVVPPPFSPSPPDTTTPVPTTDTPVPTTDTPAPTTNTPAPSLTLSPAPSTAAPTTAPPAPIPAPCVGQPPPSSICINGVWVINGSVTLPALVIDGSPVAVTGNLTITNGTLSIVISGAGNGAAPITVAGCADFAGSAVTVNSTDTSTAPLTILLVNASCVSSPFATVQVNKPVKCDKQKWNSQQSTTAGISAVFSLEGSCKSSKKLPIIIACTIGGLLVVGIVVVVLVVLVKPDLPKTMFRRARTTRPGQNVYIINA